VDRVQTHHGGRRFVVREGCVLKKFSTGPNLSGIKIDHIGRGDHGRMKGGDLDSNKLHGKDGPYSRRVLGGSVWPARSALHARGGR
jgi:hypothetical protein